VNRPYGVYPLNVLDHYTLWHNHAFRAPNALYASKAIYPYRAIISEEHMLKGYNHEMVCQNILKEYNIPFKGNSSSYSIWKALNGRHNQPPDIVANRIGNIECKFISPTSSKGHKQFIRHKWFRDWTCKDAKYIVVNDLCPITSSQVRFLKSNGKIVLTLQQFRSLCYVVSRPIISIFKGLWRLFKGEDSMEDFKDYSYDDLRHLLDYQHAIYEAMVNLINALKGVNESIKEILCGKGGENDSS
jgi:hypothetical protein